MLEIIAAIVVGIPTGWCGFTMYRDALRGPK